MTIESCTESKWGLLKTANDEGGSEALKIEETKATTLPFPFVPATWIVAEYMAANSEKDLLSGQESSQ